MNRDGEDPELGTFGVYRHVVWEWWKIGINGLKVVKIVLQIIIYLEGSDGW